MLSHGPEKDLLWPWHTHFWQEEDKSLVHYNQVRKEAQLEQLWPLQQSQGEAAEASISRQESRHCNYDDAQIGQIRTPSSADQT